MQIAVFLKYFQVGLMMGTAEVQPDPQHIQVSCFIRPTLSGNFLA